MPFVASLPLGLAVIVSVAVDLSTVAPETRAPLDVAVLRGELLARLAEEGYGGRSAAAAANLRVAIGSTASGQLALEVAGDRTRPTPVAILPATVSRLELVQRALLMLAEVTPAEMPTALPRMFVRFPGGLDDVNASRLHAGLVAQVVDHGFELVGTRAAAGAMLCTAVAGRVAWIWRTSAAAGCDLRPADAFMWRRDGEADDTFVHQLVTVAGTVLARPPVASVVVGAPASLVAATAPARPAPLGRITVSAGVVSRGALDPTAAVGVELGRGAGPYVAVRLEGSEASSGLVDVVETLAAVGPGVRAVRARFEVGAALLAGALLHRARYGQESVDHRVEWILLAPLQIAVDVGGSWRIQAAARVGRAEHVRDHRLGEQVLWRRDAWQLGVEAGLSRALP